MNRSINGFEFGKSFSNYFIYLYSTRVSDFTFPTVDQYFLKSVAISIVEIVLLKFEILLNYRI